MRRRFDRWLFLSAALLVSIALAACGEDSDRAQNLPKPIAWALVEAAERPTVRSLSGVVHAIQRAQLSFEVSGRVESVTIKVGDHFEAGQELAWLDAHSYELAVQEREAELNEVQASFSEAENNFSRQKTLHQDGWVARAGYDLALSQRDTAASRVEMARARLAIARDNLADTVLEAPYPGTVAERLIEPSQRVAAGQTVLEIQSNGGGLEVQVAFPETLVDRLAVGSTHGVTFPTRTGLALNGTVREIGSRATDNNAFPVTLVLRDAPADLRTGVTAEVAFDLSATNGTDQILAIPDTAFLAGEDEQTIVFVLDEETGTLSRREVVIGEISGNRALVSDGLRFGEIVAAKGLPFLRDGQAVKRLGVGLERYNP